AICRYGPMVDDVPVEPDVSAMLAGDQITLGDLTSDWAGALRVFLDRLEQQRDLAAAASLHTTTMQRVVDPLHPHADRRPAAARAQTHHDRGRRRGSSRPEGPTMHAATRTDRLPAAARAQTHHDRGRGHGRCRLDGLTRHAALLPGSRRGWFVLDRRDRAALAVQRARRAWVRARRAPRDRTTTQAGRSTTARPPWMWAMAGPEDPRRAPPPVGEEHSTWGANYRRYMSKS